MMIQTQQPNMIVGAMADGAAVAVHGARSCIDGNFCTLKDSSGVWGSGTSAVCVGSDNGTVASGVKLW